MQRIVAPLFALAVLAERAGAAPFPIRFVVLAILRHAERVAWAYAVEAACGPAVRRIGRRLPLPLALPDPLAAAHNGRPDAIRLALGFRTLAMIVSGWATRLLASAAVLATLRSALLLTQARPGRSGHDAAALPVPDTS